VKRAAEARGQLSRFSFTVRLLHIKSFYRISNAAINQILGLMALQYPNSEIPKSHDEALGVIGRLGLGYESIHVCPDSAC
jgi:hypothetical protein